MNTNFLKSLLSAGLLLSLAACGGTSNIGVNPNPGGADITKPAIASVSGVNDAATLSGTVAITATATDNKAVTSFTLKIDGTQVASFNSGNLSYSWDTATATNAAHVLLFTAGDLAGNTATRSINVTVNNAGGGGGGGNATVSGVVYAPNGSDPLSQALVYVAGAAASAAGDPPGVPHIAYDYTEPDGSFSLTGVPTGSQSIVMQKGAFTKTVSYTVVIGSNVLPVADTTMPASSGSSMLVVTGAYDLIGNVLAKLGLGSVDSGGNLVIGTESFAMVDGNGSLPDADYDNFDTFFATPANFDAYRTIFLNCGNDYEEAFLADTAAVAKLKSWVAAGGRLYCTDWSYDFCEQIWPEKISFYGGTGADGLTATPGTPDFAQLGSSMDTVHCTVNDAFMLSWLDGVGATNSDDTFDVIDWLPAWVPIIEVASDVKVWATGNVTYGFPAVTDDLPVTVSFDEGTGVVMFSSYHTEDFGTTELTAQDRVLQYLIFEIL
jgi:hypothetical protein